MIVEMLLSNWHRIRTKLMETIDCFSDEDLTYSAGEGLWSVHELMLHIAHEEQGEVGYGMKQELQEWPQGYLSGDYPSVSSIKVLLTEVHNQSLDYLNTLIDDDLGQLVTTPWNGEFVLGDMIGHVIEHEVHHRGELSMILGLLGRNAPDV